MNKACQTLRRRITQTALFLVIAALLLSGCVKTPSGGSEGASSGVSSAEPSPEPLPGVERFCYSPITKETYRQRTAAYATQISSGIDVSSFQGTIDWQKVKASGVTFAILRVGGRGYSSAVLYPDEYFEQNLRGATEAGLDVGVYFYSQATTVGEAIREAQYTLEQLQGATLTLPVVFDFEYYGNGEGRLFDAALTKEQATRVCEAFCETVEAAGYTAAVYANLQMLTDGLDAEWLQSQYALWIAQYATENTYPALADYWQYSSQGMVEGIPFQTDCNFRYVNVPKQVEDNVCVKSEQTALTLCWNKVPGVFGYRIQRWNPETEAYETVASQTGAGNTYFTDSGLTAGTAYHYRVCALNVAEGEEYLGEWSAGLSASTAAEK